MSQRVLLAANSVVIVAARSCFCSCVEDCNQKLTAFMIRSKVDAVKQALV